MQLESKLGATIQTGGLKREIARATVPPRVGTSSRSHGTVSRGSLPRRDRHVVSATHCRWLLLREFTLRRKAPGADDAPR